MNTYNPAAPNFAGDGGPLPHSSRRRRSRTVLLATALGGFVLVLACIVIFCLLAATTDASPRTFMATIANDGDQVFYDAIVESKPCIISDSLKNWGKQTRLIVRNGANPVLSRNGLWLFFEREGETGGEVWRHEIASGREDRVFAGRFSASFHDVNSNGSQVIAGVRNDGIGGYSFEYFLVNVGRTDGGTFVGDDACFVRGDGIVYRTAGIDGLWLREADGATRQVAPEGFLRGSSHDGQRILYISDITKEFNERKWQVYDFNSNEFFPVPPTGSATLTPDGTTVIYVEEPYPTPQMARLSLTLGSTKDLGRMPGYIADWRSGPGGVSAVACAGLTMPSAVLIYDQKADVIRQFPIAPFVPAAAQASQRQQR